MLSCYDWVLDDAISIYSTRSSLYAYIIIEVLKTSTVMFSALGDER